MCVGGCKMCIIRSGPTKRKKFKCMCLNMKCRTKSPELSVCLKQPQLQICQIVSQYSCLNFHKLQFNYAYLKAHPLRPDFKN